MHKLPKAFARRKSAANVLEEPLADVPPNQQSFRVFDRANTTNFDGGKPRLNGGSGNVSGRPSTDPERDDNMFSGFSNRYVKSRHLLYVFRYFYFYFWLYGNWPTWHKAAGVASPIFQGCRNIAAQPPIIFIFLIPFLLIQLTTPPACQRLTTTVKRQRDLQFKHRFND